jgi:hypothetical protein
MLAMGASWQRPAGEVCNISPYIGLSRLDEGLKKIGGISQNTSTDSNYYGSCYSNRYSNQAKLDRVQILIQGLADILLMDRD